MFNHFVMALKRPIHESIAELARRVVGRKANEKVISGASDRPFNLGHGR